jgi:hypothetical protein
MAINPESPLGYALTILILGVIIWWIFLKDDVMMNPKERKKIDLDSAYRRDELSCPKCGTDNPKYNLLIAPTRIKCSNCGEEWTYYPRPGSNRLL